MISIQQVIKPINPIDVSLNNRQPQKSFNFFERLKIIVIAFKKKNFKNSILYFLNLIKYIILNLLKIFYIPIIIFLKLKNIKIVKINYWQFGTMAQHAFLLYKHTIIKGHDPKKIYIYLPKNLSANKCLHQIIKKNFNVIENILTCLLLLPLTESHYLSLSVLEYDEHYPKSKASEIIKKFYLLETKNNKIQIFSKEELINLKKIFINEFGFSPEQKFVSINLRFGNFYNDFEYPNRNTKLIKYYKSINYLINKKVNIIFFNNEFKEKFFNKKNCFFLNFKKNNFMQIYVMLKSSFFICNNFGPKNVAQMMKVPCLICDLFPLINAFGYGRKDISIPKKIKFKNSNKELSFKKIINKKLLYYLPKNNFELIDNSVNDILNATKEMYKNCISLSKLKKNNYSNLIKKQFSETGHVVKDGNISENYLLNSRDLLEI
jgi:putative glycosyltransferase (TIGR04372 family)